jgi:hypothetical protein
MVKPPLDEAMWGKMPVARTDWTLFTVGGPDNEKEGAGGEGDSNEGDSNEVELEDQSDDWFEEQAAGEEFVGYFNNEQWPNIQDIDEYRGT